jgi:hypothetical protein
LARGGVRTPTTVATPPATSTLCFERVKIKEHALLE